MGELNVCALDKDHTKEKSDSAVVFSLGIVTISPSRRIYLSTALAASPLAPKARSLS